MILKNLTQKTAYPSKKIIKKTTKILPATPPDFLAITTDSIGAGEVLAGVWGGGGEGWGVWTAFWTFVLGTAGTDIPITRS